MVICGIITINILRMIGGNKVRHEEYLTVKDVSDILQTEPYVLRFYEKELNLNIKRNTKGHRVYSMEDIELFRKIQELREQGLQLKAIENIVHHHEDELAQTLEQLTTTQTHQMKSTERGKSSSFDITDIKDEKVMQFSLLMKDMLKKALDEHEAEVRAEVKEAICEQVKEEVKEEVDRKLFEFEQVQLKKSEDHYRKLDETMRELQKMRKDMAENINSQKPKESFWNKLFKEKNKTIEI